MVNINVLGLKRVVIYLQWLDSAEIVKLLEELVINHVKRGLTALPLFLLSHLPGIFSSRYPCCLLLHFLQVSAQMSFY